MSNTLPPIPYKSIVTNKSGFLTPAWIAFFRELFFRVGGNVAPTNIELNTGSNSISNTVSTHTSQIAALQTKDNDFGQGPNL